MFVKRPHLFALLLLLLATVGTPPLVAQDTAPEPNVAWYYEVEIEVADMPEFEAATEEWVARIGEDDEEWIWNVFQAVTGVPRFVIMTPGHTYADFDRDPTVSEARQAENDAWFDPGGGM